MAAFTKFNAFVENLAEGVHNLGADSLKVLLTNTAPVVGNSVKADLVEIAAGFGYAAGGPAVTVSSSSQTAGAYALVLADLVITAAGGSIGPFRYAVLYNDTSPSDSLIAFVDYGSSITLLDTESFTLDFDGAAGALSISTVDEATLAVVDAFTTPPASARVTAIDTLVAALKAAGVWAKLDSLYVLAAADSQAARVDWKVPTRAATEVGAPVFAADRGYTMSATNYVNSNFNPSTSALVMTALDPMVGVYERTNLNSGNHAIGANNGANLIELSPRDGSNNLVGRVNNGTQTTFAASITDSRGMTSLQREGSNGQSFKNGVGPGAVALAGGVTSSLPNFPFFIGTRNNAGTAATVRATQIAAAWVGGALTSQQHADFYTALQAYMTTVGANV